jgi:hypothetical protein
MKFPSNLLYLIILMLTFACRAPREHNDSTIPGFTLIQTEQFVFNSFVDCNMAEAWIGDTLRIFPGKYGEDPVWGEARELEYAGGTNPDEVFLSKPDEFTDPNFACQCPTRQTWPTWRYLVRNGIPGSG